MNKLLMNIVNQDKNQNEYKIFEIFINYIILNCYI